jgi:hypothetical protein
VDIAATVAAMAAAMAAAVVTKASPLPLRLVAVLRLLLRPLRKPRNSHRPASRGTANVACRQLPCCCRPGDSLITKGRISPARFGLFLCAPLRTSRSLFAAGWIQPAPALSYEVP